MIATPQRPTMIYDGECGFCSRWIARWQRMTGDSIAYAPFQRVLPEFPQVSEAAARDAVQLVLPDGEVLSGAAAVARTLRDVPGWGWTHFAYTRMPGVGWTAEAVYGLVARNRARVGRIASLA